MRQNRLPRRTSAMLFGAVQVTRGVRGHYALVALLTLILPLSRPAEANVLTDIGSGMCSLVNGGSSCTSTSVSELSCDIKLGAATGVPNSSKRTYAFTGTCTSRTSGTVVALRAAGKWDDDQYMADEAINIDPLGAGSLGGGVVSRFRCEADPWLNPGTHCSVIDRKVSTMTQVFSFQNPATASYVSPEQAARLSKQSAAGAPPPPPPPAPKQEASKSASTASREARMRLGGGPVPLGGTRPQVAGVAPAGPSDQAKLEPAKPRLRVAAQRTQVDNSCGDLHRLLTVSVTLYNDGGPLMANRGEVYVKEAGGALLSSAGIRIPDLGHARQVELNIPVGTMESYRTKLPGTHRLEVHVVSGEHAFAALTHAGQVTLPAGFCAGMAGVKSPSKALLPPLQQRASPALNPQPEPPAPRLALPAH